MAVRVRRFWGPIIAVQGAWRHIWTVPAGRTARFYRVSLWNPAPGASTVYLGFGTAVAVQDVMELAQMAAGTSALVGVGLVLNPGDAVWLNSAGNNISTFGHGALLLGAPS